MRAIVISSEATRGTKRRKMAKFILFFLVLNFVLPLGVVPQFLVPAAAIAGISIAFTYWMARSCYVQECCTDRWIINNITGLEYDLKYRVFGQHLVSKTVFRAIKGHLANKSPQKALALSLTGCTGCGKNHVSKIIANNIFAKGTDSQFVNSIISTHEFAHNYKLEDYKTFLKKWVIGNVKNCARSLFIFDEMDKMPEGLVDVLKPFLDHHPKVEGTDFRKAIFIFLSNTGSKFINSETLKHWRSGKSRSEITIKQMDSIINLGAFNEQGGFWHTALIEKHLIDYFIPFLPLERSHIKECARVDLKAKNHRTIYDDLLERIANQMQYSNPDKIFSKSGCKKIPSKVDFVLG